MEIPGQVPPDGDGVPRMDIRKMLAELRAEGENPEYAILTLLRPGKCRGRPQAWMTALKECGPPPGSKTKPKAD